ncbi:nickel ABC transporter substrate-binding protein [Campylobacter sp. faydin G-24]|uniref:Nickel ABC transporter substrate-binding protein n=1 Tax=Campylobacter anatolicus TaxID=2829105 RepID=A0ABS5HK71_9BACT|nr:nickel ABC transporter substrate-binding protein [Campylobacter anatolicus]MBR8464639.1 nickel ABC transporter substrate-binding protein [Campylobacter anatolicus]
MMPFKFKSMILVLVAFSFIFFGCSETTSKKQIKTELVYASTKDIRNINPHLYSGEMAAQNMVFEPLILDTKDGIKPNLAQRWEIIDGDKSYIFHLRKDIKFSDGSEFDANVVKQNIDAVLANRTRHAWLELINEIQSTEVVDKFTFKLNLKNPYYPTLTELAMTRPFRFLSPNCFENGSTKDGVKCLVGTGAWVLSKYDKNAFALFERNENYWGEKPKLKSVKWRVIPDHQTMLLALQKGEIDLIFGADGDMINLDAFKAVQNSDKLATLLSEPIASRAILLNSKQPITMDIKVREALVYAVNKQDIVSGILNGTEKVADTLFAKTTPYANIELVAKKFDPTKAAQILDEAGYKKGDDGYRYKDNVKLSLRLYFNINNAQEKVISEYIQSNFKDIGIELKIYGEEKQAFLDRQKNGDFDLQYSLSWGIPYDPQSYISSWRTPTHGDYQAQLGLEKKEWLDTKIKQILIEPDELKRTQMYKEIFTYIHESNIYIPLSYSRTKAVFVPNLKGVGFNISQYEIPFEKMHFE